jgi:hypothetical protein
MRRLLAILAVPIVLATGCSVAQTSKWYGKPPEQVTQADRIAAWNTWQSMLVARQQNPILTCIRAHESANLANPWAAFSPAGPYYGAYQYDRGTWNAAASATGRADLVGRAPMEPGVSRWDQDEVTLGYHAITGGSPWGNTC